MRLILKFNEENLKKNKKSQCSKNLKSFIYIKIMEYVQSKIGNKEIGVLQKKIHGFYDLEFG